MIFFKIIFLVAKGSWREVVWELYGVSREGFVDSGCGVEEKLRVVNLKVV